MTEFKELVRQILYDNLNINENLCYIWTGGIDPNIGYGRVMIQGKRYHTHRLSAYISLGLDLDDPKQYACHTCANRLCWNPSHLYIGDNKSNQLDANTVCKRGHLMTEDNIQLHRRPNGEYFRECKACRKLRSHGKIVKISG